MEAILTRRLGKVYDGGTLALQDLDLRIEQGSVFGLLGPNGAGKSTATRILNGALSPSSGEAWILGKSSGDPTLREITGTVTETARMYEGLSVRENLVFFGRMHDMDGTDIKKRVTELLERLDLAAKVDAGFGTLSTGQKKRIQLARALLHRPALLFLDEPTAGLDPEIARETIALIREIASRDGTTVLLCTHDLALADTICSAYGFIDHGRLKACGTRPELETQAGLCAELRVVTTTQALRYPLAEHPDANSILRDLMDQGQRIVEARRERPSLESLYFSFIAAREEQHVN